MRKSPVSVFSYWQTRAIDERCARQPGEPVREPRPRALDDRRIDEPLCAVGIQYWPVAIDANLEPVAVEVWNTVEAGLEVDPDRQAPQREAIVAGWRAEMQHLLSRRTDARANRFRKQRRQPRPAGADESIRLQPFSRGGDDLRLRA